MRNKLFVIFFFDLFKQIAESYEKITKNICMNPNEYKGSKNVDRMRETIASKKHDLSKELW